MAISKQILFLILLVLSAHISLSQEVNFVPNTSFEEYNVLPSDVAQGNRCLDVWRFPNFPGNGDYYHSNATNKKANTVKNYFGKQEPHSGEAYAGICITKDFREYLQIKLNQQLVKNTMYIIELYISCADKAYLSTVQEFSVIFSKKDFTLIGNDYLYKPPAITFFESEGYKNKKDWHQLTYEYVADGTEEYFTFGCFLYEKDGETHGLTSGIAKYAHYYVDDISIKLAKIDKEEVLSLTENNTTAFNTIGVNTFSSLQFETGKSTILDQSFSEIDQLIAFMKEHPELKLILTGHTDNVGGRNKNITLSLDRANSVKKYITTHSTISEEMIETFGTGDLSPKFPNDNNEHRKLNRRVEFLLK